MAYEAQIAGVGDAGHPLLQRIQRRSAAELRERRGAAVAAVRELADLDFVNGGGTGSLESTSADPSVTELAAGHDHYEAYWWPHTERMSTKAHARLPLDAEHRPQGRLARTLQAEVLGNGAGAVVTGLGLAAPALTPGINRVVSRWFAHGERTGPSPEIFTAPRRVRFTEMEYALPLEALPSAVRELQRLVEREGWRISFPVELGTAAADDTWLSTAYGRATSYVAVHRYWREDWRPYFTAAEAIFRDHDGRPHWGKLHTRTHDDLLAVCPRLADVAAVRDRLDPDEGGGRRFTNDYVAQVLGD